MLTIQRQDLSGEDEEGKDAYQLARMERVDMTPNTKCALATFCAGLK